MTIHIPVLPQEVIDGLNPQPGSTIVDGTLGGGGHAEVILERIGATGTLFGFDRDPIAVEDTKTRISAENAHLIIANYSDMPEQLSLFDVTQVDGILLDLGLSSDQLADRERGFSFHSDGPLDLHFN